MAPALTSNGSNNGVDVDTHSVSGTRFAGPFWLQPGVADRYAKGEAFTGPFSIALLLMQNFDKLSVKPGSRLSILDVCCGSGVTTHHMQSLLKMQGLEGQVDVTCGDLSESQLAYLDHRIKKNGWKNTKTVKMNLEKTGAPSATFDHIVCAQGIFIIPDAQAAVAEIYRMVKPGGTVSFGNWHKEMWIYDAQAALSQLPGAPNWPQSSDEMIAAWSQGPWHDRNYAKSMLQARGFEDIQVRTHSEMIPINDAEHFYYVYEPFFEWVTDRYWSEKQRTELRPLIKDAILKHINNKYGHGKPFATEKVCLLVTARKPLQ